MAAADVARNGRFKGKAGFVAVFPVSVCELLHAPVHVRFDGAKELSCMSLSYPAHVLVLFTLDMPTIALTRLRHASQ